MAKSPLSHALAAPAFWCVCPKPQSARKKLSLPHPLNPSQSHLLEASYAPTISAATVLLKAGFWIRLAGNKSH